MPGVSQPSAGKSHGSHGALERITSGTGLPARGAGFTVEHSSREILQMPLTPFSVDLELS